MTWTLLIALLVVLALACAAAWHRRAELARQQEAIGEREVHAGRSSDAAPLQVPVIDLSRCLGCGTCVRSCPEEGVLQLVHGQASVVNAGACVGHGNCVAECPVGAVTLTQGDLSSRRDVPVLEHSLQAVGTPGLFLAGEITARALIRTATQQGAQVVRSIQARSGEASSGPVGELDLVIVGAGPGGLSAALAAREAGLEFVLIDQETVVGGTVAKYPRRKLVLTEPIELPLHGRMPQREYEKEELVQLWQELAERHELPFRGGVRFERVARTEHGGFVVHTDAGEFAARHVVLAVGRRGTPRRLGVPGEDLPHVAYGLIDAAAYVGVRVVVVGGGDSAVEAALALAEQDGNGVEIVYRQDDFFRIRSKNRKRLDAQLEAGAIRVRFRSTVEAIYRDRVVVRTRGGVTDRVDELAAEFVFVFAGGTAPFEMLERSGVSFDPSMRPAVAEVAMPTERGVGLLPALAIGLCLALATTAFLLWHFDYYGLSNADRAADPKHAWLSPDRQLGLGFGLAATAAILVNLAYLLRRHQWLSVRFGSLATWMTTHVGSGVLAVLLAMLHAAMAPRDTPGGHAFWALFALLITGAIGRWFYAWLPRATNGSEIELASVRAELAAATMSCGNDAFGAKATGLVHELLERRQWRSTFFGRAVALVGLQWDLWRTLRTLRREGLATGVEPGALQSVIGAVRQAHGAAVAVAHLEDLRSVLGTWRWLHRWMALLMMLLLLVHVVLAAMHGAFSSGGVQ
jgi:dihydropyrimidine dehydrogenase (NAD+) subunit PreT